MHRQCGLPLRCRVLLQVKAVHAAFDVTASVSEVRARANSEAMASETLSAGKAIGLLAKALGRSSEQAGGRADARATMHLQASCEMGDRESKLASAFRGGSNGVRALSIQYGMLESGDLATRKTATSVPLPDQPMLMMSIPVTMALAGRDYARGQLTILDLRGVVLPPGLLSYTGLSYTSMTPVKEFAFILQEKLMKQKLQAGMKRAARSKELDSFSALHKAMFTSSGERSQADVKLLIAQVLNHVPGIYDMHMNTRVQLAHSVFAAVRASSAPSPPAFLQPEPLQSPDPS
jgi:hypothetical protein